MRNLLCALIGVFGCAMFAQQSQPSTYLVIYKPGPAFLTGKPISAQPLGDHGRYLLSLHSKGTLKIAGPFTDDSGGALMFSAASDAEAKEIITKDPAVISGVFVYEMHPWGLVDWESWSKKAPAK